MNYWQTFWVLGKTERQGILFLLVCILLSLFLPAWLSPNRQLTDKPDPAMLAVLDSLQKAETLRPAHSLTPKEAASAVVLHSFDPNTINKAGLVAMGLSEKTADSWLRFREKGGKFKKAEDIRKLYALRANDADRLLPFVRIPELTTSSTLAVPEKSTKTLIRVDLNSADSLKLLEVPGIGPGFASRILQARSRWGGWFNATQLLQIYGMDSTRLSAWLPYIELNVEKVTKLPINTAEVGVLGRHPVLGFARAKRLVAYREQHGAFKKPADLYVVYGMDSATVQQIAPYLQW